jgi:hypothetical protein
MQPPVIVVHGCSDLGTYQGHSELVEFSEFIRSLKKSSRVTGAHGDVTIYIAFANPG